MRIEGYNFDEEPDPFVINQKKLVKFKTETIGRKVFVVMQTELECIIGIYKITYNIDSIDADSYNLCYEVFFNGIDYIKNKKYEKYIEFIRQLEHAKINHKNPISRSNYQRKLFRDKVELKFNYKPFSGHSSRLGHYYRQLFLAVKTVADNKDLSDPQKLDYLKLLRAQLSNHEQILLFYNWLNPNFGGQWEKDKEEYSGIRNYFSKYKMIHNLWYDKLIQDSWIEERIDWIRARGEDVFEIDFNPKPDSLK